MYKLIIPVFNRKHTDRQKTALVGELKRAKADMALLTFSRVLRNAEALQREKEIFLENKGLIEDAGIEVGAWLAPTVGYGGTGSPSENDHDAYRVYTRIRHLNGKELFSYCPLDGAFVDDFVNTLLTLCSTGVKLVLFEDDFTLSGGKSYDFGCACEKHLALYSSILGEKTDFDSLRSALYSQGKNPVRDAWIEGVKRTLRDFAGTVSDRIHAVYPNVRLGLSANSSSYNLEGCPMPELARVIAGPNRPFVRLTGAPYWKNALAFGSNAEAIRLQKYWCGADIETVTEGDTYPRPRHWVPATLLERYDMMTRAASKNDGILKYMLDYVSSADSETGYTDAHLKNAPHYDAIERFFADAEYDGINVLENPGLIEYEQFNETFGVERYCRNNHLPTLSQEFLCDNSIPTVYGAPQKGSVVFGENARFVTEEDARSGLVLDGRAAIILSQRGFDVGFGKWENAPQTALEHFISTDENCPASLEQTGELYRFFTVPGAEVLSEFISGSLVLSAAVSGSDSVIFPACYYYENSAGQRFLVYSFAARSARVKKGWHRGYFRSYQRQDQLIDGIARLRGRPLPAVCRRAPELYIVCGRSEGSLSVALFNNFPDSIPEPEVELDRAYSSAELYHCAGKLDGRVLRLDEIPPYGFALFRVRR